MRLPDQIVRAIFRNDEELETNKYNILIKEHLLNHIFTKSYVPPAGVESCPTVCAAGHTGGPVPVAALQVDRERNEAIETCFNKQDFTALDIINNHPSQPKQEGSKAQNVNTNKQVCRFDDNTKDNRKRKRIICQYYHSLRTRAKHNTFCPTFKKPRTESIPVNTRHKKLYAYNRYHPKW